jgi:Tfp pilus assembly protein PilF
VELRRQTANTRRIVVTKIGPLFFLLSAGVCPAQLFHGYCCEPAATPAQRDWTQWISGNAAGGPGIADQASGETISAARLRHQPPRRARTAFLRGVKLSTAGDYRGAASEFANAIAADPDFSEAHGNLAVEYTWTGRLEDSVPEFQRALQLDPATALHHANFSYTLIQLKRFADAEAEAQTAVGLNPSDAVAQFLLGCLLARRAETRSLSETHLRYAARSLPEAHLALARVYNAQGDIQVAGAELKRYRGAAALKKEQSPGLGFLPRR